MPLGVLKALTLCYQTKDKTCLFLAELISKNFIAVPFDTMNNIL